MPAHTSINRGRKRRLRVGAALLGAAVAAACLAAAAVAGAAGTVGSANSAELRARVAVAQGHTLYALSPETSRHLLCKTSACLRVWPALTVRSRKAHLSRGAGVHGRLGLVKRGRGVFQVTLNGMPLYRFRFDGKPGQARGQGIKSFGGVWHAVLATGKASKAPHPALPKIKLPPPYEPPTYTPGPPVYPSPIY